ncbi:hypothetical protein RvY_16016 [Ramazzottius varieornatus]|uniref:GCF C-terminal domain-containing protein n=1 Tax=Ramazzottius varieornatus TaxID=947166 RepID=A0A1D1VY13_RAMVA|nr:hypothetical protein RvY_16016 [Ramazzottius varieornatus]
MSWFKCMMPLLFGGKMNPEVKSSDPDVRVIPIIVEDVVFSKLTALLDVWDPLSSFQTRQLVGFLQQTFKTFPVIDKKRKPVEELFRAIVQRLRLAIEDDVYLPLYSQRLLESDAEAARFAAEQYRSAFKLFCNAMLFHGILSNSILVELAIERLLNRYLLTPIRNSHNTSESVQRCLAIAQKIPEDRLQAEFADSLAVPKYLQQFCHAAANLGKKNPNREEVSSLARALMQLRDFDRAEEMEKQLPRFKS